MSERQEEVVEVKETVNKEPLVVELADVELKECAKKFHEMWDGIATERLGSRFKAAAKIKADDCDKVIKRILDYIELFNMIPSDTQMLFNRPLEGITILNEFKPFLRPFEVRVDILDRRGKDLLGSLPRWKVIPDVVDKSYSFAEWEELQMRFRNILRKEVSSDRSNIADVMKPVNLFDIISKSSCNNMCVDAATPYWPIEIAGEVGTALFVKDRYFVVDWQSMAIEFLAMWLL